MNLLVRLQNCVGLLCDCVTSEETAGENVIIVQAVSIVAYL